jgi:hypothetical protein
MNANRPPPLSGSRQCPLIEKRGVSPSSLNRGLGAIRNPHLSENAVEVTLDGPFGDREGLADLTVAPPGDHMAKDLQLAGGQLRSIGGHERERSVTSVLWHRPEVGDQ